MLACPDCGGDLRVYRTYPRPAHNSVRHYCQCQSCGEKFKTDTVIAGRISRRLAEQPTLDYDRVLDSLRRQMARQTFDTWVKSTSVHQYNGNGRVVIAVSNAYAKDWLENRLVGMFERSLAEEIGHTVEVEFIVEEALTDGFD